MSAPRPTSTDAVDSDGVLTGGVAADGGGSADVPPAGTAGRRGSVGARLGCAVCRLPGAAAAGGRSVREGLEGLFWQSIMNSANPADFEAYLRRFPNGVFLGSPQTGVGGLRRGLG